MTGYFKMYICSVFMSTQKPFVLLLLSRGTKSESQKKSRRHLNTD